MDLRDSRGPNTPAASLVGPTSSTRLPPAIPDYQLLRCIGRGSYGDVWLSRNVLGDLRAIKFVYRDRFIDPRPFEREFEGIQRFEPISRSHPSQLHILHVGKNELVGCFYYVMEAADAMGDLKGGKSNGIQSKAGESDGRGEKVYVPRTLRSELELHGRLPASECIEIGLSLSTALQHLHEQGLVHRDIKPSNVIFVNGVAKLGDIGLVTDAGDTQSIVGTEGYLPPEGPGTAQADIYSLGKVLYEISTGMDRRRLPELPADFREWSDVTNALELNEVVLKACARSLEDRYGSVEELRCDLECLSRNEPIVRARLAPDLKQRSTSRMRVATFSILMLLLALVWMRRFDTTRINPSDRLSDVAQAVTEYHKGVYCARRDTEEGNLQGNEYFNRAIQLDPKFTMAYNGLFEGYMRTGDTAAAKRCVAKMLELEPDLAEAHAALGLLAYGDWHWPDAERHFLHAIELNPKCAIAHMRYGYTLLHVGRIKDSRRELLIAEQLDPTFPRIKKNLGHVHYVERRFVEAIQEYRNALKLEPSYPMPHRFIGQSWRALGDYQKGIDEMEIAALDTNQDADKVRRKYSELRSAFLAGGTNGYWHAVRQQSEETGNLYSQARASAQLGEMVRAFELLDQFYATNDWLSLDNLVRDECWDSVHEHPRFIALLQKTGLRFK